MPSLSISEAFALAAQWHQSGRLADAEALYRQILTQQPRHADTLHLLGVLAHQTGRDEIAVENLRRAIAENPTVADYHNNFAVVLDRLNRLDESAAACRTALALNPASPATYNNLGNVLRRQGLTDEAVSAYTTALRLDPGYADAHCNLGVALKDGGELDAAIAAFRTALRLRPDFPKAHSHLIFTLHYHQDTDAGTLARELRAWRERFADPLQPTTPPLLRPSPGRRWRIGYVSPDLRRHAVGRFLLPLFQHHDRAQFEICCYSDVDVADAMTREFRSHADRWHDTLGWSDTRLADQIRADEIDLLIDLTLHTARNRLLVFARQPAPVQMTYLAYCGSSGLRTMDYRLTDPYFDPPDSDASAYSERSIFLPTTYWCFSPMADCPPVTSLPASVTGQLTLGCLNNFCKITEPTLATWSRLLCALPTARLRLHAPQGRHRARVIDRLASAGVAPTRIDFIGSLPMRDYMAAYQEIDIGLDPFPYGGGTTTCDALWMGVPVVTLAGRIAVARAGSSILHNIGLPELVASDPDDYAARVLQLAADLPALSRLRAGLRQRMLDSPLMDAPRFARDVEAAYQQMLAHKGTAA